MVVTNRFESHFSSFPFRYLLLAEIGVAFRLPKNHLQKFGLRLGWVTFDSMFRQSIEDSFGSRTIVEIYLGADNLIPRNRANVSEATLRRRGNVFGTME